MWFKKKDPVRAILDRYMDGEFALFACGENAPSEKTVAEFEKEVGCRLPKDFRAFSMSSLGGVYIEVKEAIWPRAKVYDVAPFWSFLYGVFAFGFGKDVPEWMDIRIQTESFMKETGQKAVPILKIMGDADLFCVSAEGRICQWQHETGTLSPFEGSFLDLFEREVRSLKERKERKKAEPSSAGDVANRAAPEK